MAHSLPLDDRELQALREIIRQWPQIRAKFPKNALVDVLDGHVHTSVPEHDHGGSTGGNTLDEAYDEGGAGAGRQINVTDGAVLLVEADGDSNALLEISRHSQFMRAAEFRVTGDTQPYFRSTVAGSLQWGAGGTSTPDVALGRTAANTLALAAGDQLQTATINEVATNPNTGVTVDGVLIKDGQVDGVDVSGITTKFVDHIFLGYSIDGVKHEPT